VYVAPPPPTYPDVRGSWAGTKISTNVYSTGDTFNYSYTVVWVFNQTSTLSSTLSGSVTSQNDETGATSTVTFTGTVTTNGNLSIAFEAAGYSSSCEVQTGSRTYTGSLVSGTMTISNNRTDLCTFSGGIMATLDRNNVYVVKKI
jgi:hypothetical protein